MTELSGSTNWCQLSPDEVAEVHKKYSFWRCGGCIYTAYQKYVTLPPIQWDAHVLTFPEANSLLKLAPEAICDRPVSLSSFCGFHFSFSFHYSENKHISYLLWLVKDILKIAERGSRKLSEDFSEKLFRINRWTTAPVLPPSAGTCCTRIKTSRAVGIVLFPLHFIT